LVHLFGDNIKNRIFVLSVFITLIGFSVNGCSFLDDKDNMLNAYRDDFPNLVSGEELDQYQNNYDYDCFFGRLFQDKFYVSQSFTPTKETLTKIQLYLSRDVITLGQCKIAIRSNLAGENLAEVSIPIDDFPIYPNYLWLDINFNYTDLTINQTYYIVAYVEAIGIHLYYWGGNSSDVYKNGTMYFYYNGTWFDCFSDMCFRTYGVNNIPPNNPNINGPKEGEAGKEYEYFISSVDPESEDVYYYIDWGDGNTTEWIGPFESGKRINISHTWSKKGSYSIKLKAKDQSRGESDWTFFKITMPKDMENENKIIKSYKQIELKLIKKFEGIGVYNL
jgi:hypothetical protein